MVLPSGRETPKSFRQRVVGDETTAVPTEQQTPVAIEDTNGDQIDPLSDADQPLDVSAAEVDVDIATQTLEHLVANLDEVAGQQQSAVDIADRIEQLADALQAAFAADDQLRVDLQNNNAGTLAVEQQTPVGVENASGTQVNPATNDDQPNYYDEDIDSYDLIGDGDYTTPEVNVRGTGDLIIKVTSDDNATFTATVEWTDGNGTVLYEQSPAEATGATGSNLKFNVASTHFRLTITDTSGGPNSITGTINAH